MRPRLRLRWLVPCGEGMTPVAQLVTAWRWRWCVTLLAHRALRSAQLGPCTTDTRGPRSLLYTGGRRPERRLGTSSAARHVKSVVCPARSVTDLSGTG